MTIKAQTLIKISYGALARRRGILPGLMHRLGMGTPPPRSITGGHVAAGAAAAGGLGLAGGAIAYPGYFESTLGPAQNWLSDLLTSADLDGYRRGLENDARDAKKIRDADDDRYSAYSNYMRRRYSGTPEDIAYNENNESRNTFYPQNRTLGVPGDPDPLGDLGHPDPQGDLSYEELDANIMGGARALDTVRRSTYPLTGHNPPRPSPSAEDYRALQTRFGPLGPNIPTAEWGADAAGDVQHRAEMLATQSRSPTQ